MIIEYNGSNLNDGLFYFYASWNSNCNSTKQKLERLNFDNKNITIYRINVTKFPELKEKYKVSRIPSYMIVKNNNIITRRDGNIDFYSLNKWIKESNR